MPCLPKTSDVCLISDHNKIESDFIIVISDNENFYVLRYYLYILYIYIIKNN